MIRTLSRGDIAEVKKIADVLPEWFTEEGRSMIERDARYQFGFISEEESEIVGFLTYFVNQGIAHIGWMGILPGCQRQGIGSALLNALVGDMKFAGVTIIEVSTLGDSVHYPPYDRSRNFYYKMGFVEHERKLHDSASMPEELILRYTIV